MAGAFRFLDDIALADLAFEATGDSLLDLFNAATDALLNCLADPATIEPRRRRRVVVEEADIPTLLFEWLNRLVYLKDAEALLCHHVDLSLTPSTGERGWRLEADLLGDAIDPVAHTLRNDVKGVTKHLYAVTHDERGRRARVVVDV